VHYRHPDETLVGELRARDGISSVQVTFHSDVPLEQHAMPPGGFRLAVINCFDLEIGIAAREQLELAFWSTRSIGRGREPDD
jgi:hypothetical protein